jgi:hypothetical protein
MNIPIYQSEINDGLGEQIKNNSVAYVAVASPGKVPQVCEDKDLQKLLAQKISDNKLPVSLRTIAENKDQIDLYYIKSVLVSTGWNKNDDVFDPQELWDARNTPEDKPFNFMHDEKDIIGHITANEVVDFNGGSIDVDSPVAPKEFNILTSAVIYTEWSDIEQKQRLNQIVAEIEDNKWFVSMECLFPNFDYALKNSKGETKVVSRNEASAFLTKHLRSYGGTGKYDDYQVGRLLRNLSFSGKGLVSKPANPRSIILEGNDFFDESQSKLLTLSSLKEKNSMSDQDNQVQNLKAELAESKAANEALKEKAEKEAKAGYETQIAELEAQISTQAEELEQAGVSFDLKSKAFDALNVAKTELEEAAVAMKEEVDKMKKKEAMMKRKAQLAEAGFEAEEAEATVSEFENLADEDFDRVIALLKKSAKKDKEESEAGLPPALKEAIEKKKKEKEGDDAKAEVSPELDPAEASVELLENAETPQEAAVAQINSEQESEQETLRASAQEWIGSLLKSNK